MKPGWKRLLQMMCKFRNLKWGNGGISNAAVVSLRYSIEAVKSWADLQLPGCRTKGFRAGEEHPKQDTQGPAEKNRQASRFGLMTRGPRSQPNQHSCTVPATISWRNHHFELHDGGVRVDKLGSMTRKVLLPLLCACSVDLSISWNKLCITPRSILCYQLLCLVC
jgi:hypothetical protein